MTMMGEAAAEYRRYSKSWEPIGFADEPQYPGQQPVRFPVAWPPSQCFRAVPKED